MERGLSLPVNKTLGRRLNKTFQVSDWERRPLNADQLHYAALDAYCLLGVWFPWRCCKENEDKSKFNGERQNEVAEVERTEQVEK